ncbi:hypothetical protein NB311A_18838 [Nitrobacter sp. Nb-311A]|nr:hypothetical protein NB311A_18838 [Nitrobacter sp. Nb-311A]
MVGNTWIETKHNEARFFLFPPEITNEALGVAEKIDLTLVTLAPDAK